MKKQLFSCAILAFSCSFSYAQLKVSNNGGIGLGIEPRSDYKLIMKGNLLLTTYPEIPPSLNRYTELRFKVGSWGGCEIGSPTRRINFWADEIGYNDLYAAHYYSYSDATIKTEITPFTNALEKIQQINSYSYKTIHDTITDTKKTIGFLAQEIQSIIPDIIDTAKGIMLIDYQQMIPLLVQAIKEQQITIDSLKNSSETGRNMIVSNNDKQTTDSIIKEINELKKTIYSCCNMQQNQTSQTDLTFISNSRMYQNKPNPFSEKTVIEFEIIENFQSASIMIFDMQGNLKKTIPIYQSGKGLITINRFELNQGMFLYSLIIDNKEIDTKRMILTN